LADSVADKSFASSNNTERGVEQEEDSNTPLNRDRPAIDKKMVKFGTEEDAEGLPEDQEWAEI
jgi:hypothetical protein